ncbi:MAG TPA: hypothetical protein VN946_10455 [Terriglobales bacterium]|nr:hypothetical protein [Terriglobales bacterium]
MKTVGAPGVVSPSRVKGANADPKEPAIALAHILFGSLEGPTRCFNRQIVFLESFMTDSSVTSLMIASIATRDG